MGLGFKAGRYLNKFTHCNGITLQGKFTILWEFIRAE